MKIWLRTSKHILQYGRTSNGTALAHDELYDAFNSMGIECLDEWPPNGAHCIPNNPEEYLEMWWADPAEWEINLSSPRRGLVGFQQANEDSFIYNIPRNDARYDKMMLCDAIFVSCNATIKYNKHLFPMPIYLLTGGFKTDQFYYVNRKFDESPFRLLHCSAEWRKGSDIACEAFIKAFPFEQDVGLEILAIGETDMFRLIQQKYLSDSRISLVINVIEDRYQMLQQYYQPRHVLVFPSIGEGWGRCLTEAMASGMPCLTSRCSAMLDQFHDNCGWWIELTNDAIPDINDLAKKMRLAYENRDECRLRGMNAHNRAFSILTWEYGIRQALPILEKVYESSIHN